MIERKNSNYDNKDRYIIDQTELIAKTGSWELNLITNELFWSDGVYRILEKEPNREKLDFNDGLNIIYPEDRELAIQKFNESIEKGIEYRVKKRFVTYKNNIKHIISSGKVIRDEHQKPIKIIGIFQDITEFVESTEKFELLNKITEDVIYEWDVQKDEFSWGKGFTKIFGYEIDDKPFKLEDWAKLMHPIDDEKHKEDWNNFLKDKNRFQWIKEFRFKRKDNSYAYVEETAILLRNDEGYPIKMIGLLRDTSAKKIINIQKKVQHQIATLFKADKKTEIVLEEILEYLTNYDNFLTTEIWFLDDSKQSIYLKKWNAKNSNIEKFYKKTKNITRFEKGIGLPGITWETKSYHLWKTHEIDKYFLRAKQANDIGVKSILSIPLFNNSEFIGALLLFSKEDLTLDQLKIEPYLSLSEFLGSEIHRKIQEEMFLLMFENAPDIIATANANGYFTRVNKAFTNILGYTEEELTSNPFTFFIHPDDLNQTENEYSETISGERKADNFINRYRTKSGEYIWIAWSSSEIFGEETTSFAYGRNITEITELQNLFKETAKLAEIGSWEYEIGSVNKKIFLSKVAKDILEIEIAAEINLDFVLDFTYPEFRRKTKKAFDRLINKGENFDIEIKIKTAKNNTKWVRCIGKAEFNNENIQTKTLGSIQNITTQKNNEIELAQKNIFLSSITSVVTELIHRTDWYESLSNVFQITGNTIDVDRIYFFETDENTEKTIESCSQKMEWTKKGISSQINNPNLQNIPTQEFEHFFAPLLNGELFKANLSELPEGNLKENIKIQGVKSFLVFPLFVSNKFYGFVGFDDCTKERQWTNSEIAFLSNIAYNLSTTIQRRKTNIELEKSLREKNNILDSIDDAFISLDQNWIVKYWNKKSESIVNLKRDQIIGKNFWEVFPQLLGTIYEKNYKESLKTQKSITFQDFFEELNIWLDVTTYPSKSGLSIYYKDITDLKKNEFALITSNDRFEKSTAATNDAIWDWDLEKKSLYRGEGFYKLFGYKLPNYTYSSNASILSLIKSRVRPDEANEVINSLVEIINNPNQDIWKKEYWYKKADGNYAYIANNGVIIRNEEGKAIRIVGALQDLTKRKEQEDALKILNKKLQVQTKELLKSNQELEQFAYIASHDLQEPLRMVTSFLTQLEKKYYNELDDKGKQYIEFAVDGAHRMRNIILDILEYSKIGKIEEENETIDLNKIMNEVCKMNAQKIQETNASISYNNLPKITAPKSPLVQIMHNLIGNALKYQKDNNQPIIKIKVTEHEKNWHFKIKDNGIGIEEEYLNKIFVIFQRLHTKNEYSGNGMGLAIVKKLIENLNGKIWVKSQPNKGSTFYFTLQKK